MPAPSHRQVHFNLAGLPPAIRWQLTTNISRSQVRLFCEQMHDIALENHGAAFYYPEPKKGRTRCRYELHGRRGHDRYGFRIIFHFYVSDEDLQKVDVLVALHEAIDNPTVGPPQLTAKQQSRLKAYSSDVLHRAARPSAPSIQHTLFYMECPGGLGSKKAISTADGTIRIFSTMVLKDLRRVSALSVSIEAVNTVAARALGLRKAMLAYALLTLLHGNTFKTATNIWPKGSRVPEFVESPHHCELRTIYPKSARLIEGSATLTKEFRRTFAQATNLPEGQRDAFLQALFAHYAGTDLMGRQPTLAGIAHHAVLSRVSKERGALRGEKRSDERAQIYEMLCDMFSPEKEARDSLDVILKRFYKRQRSAFVHGAVLRHEEDHQGDDYPATMPSDKDIVSELWYFRNDLLNIASFSRLTLLGWLAELSDDNESTEILARRFKIHSVPMEVSTRIPPRTEHGFGLQPPSKS